MKLAVGLLVAWVCTGVSSGEPPPRSLTFDERIKAQTAIEEVYWKHRIWPKENPQPKPPLSTVMSDDSIRAKVEDYLKKSNALETWWHRPITGEQLQAEMDRMAKGSRDPAVLQELFLALGNDPYLIAETLGRQMLADRLIRNWYANDARLHRDTRARAEAALASCASVDRMNSMNGEYRETTLKLRADAVSDERAGDHEAVLTLGPEEWKPEVDRLAARFGVVAESIPVKRLSPLEETTESFVVTAILANKRGEITTASTAWRKATFLSWWASRRASEPTQVIDTASSFKLPRIPSVGCTADSWSHVGPDPRVMRGYHTAVWTGSEMIVWGGYAGVYLNSGDRYNPVTDTWLSTSMGANVPDPRYLHTVVWTGTEMIVWGGSRSNAALSSGARYNPSSDTWSPTSTGVNAPSARYAHTAVWTGTEMIIWGGGTSTFFPTTGGRYNPATDSWAATSILLGTPLGRRYHTAVWSGTEMIVWGGEAGDGYAFQNTGGRYSPSTNTWTPTSTGSNVPSERRFHTAVWSGTEMIVWGGDNNNSASTGGRYNPSADRWDALPTGPNVPTARSHHVAVWTGAAMVVWGGGTYGAELNSGGLYSPSTDTWKATSVANAPDGRAYHTTAVWTGTEMIVWGGSGYNLYVNTGGRYDPSTDSWVATPTGAEGAPAPRSNHAAVWTGSEMIMWGGFGVIDFNTGGRYSPSTDSWVATSTGTNVPAARSLHTAVWTGSEVIIWGGATSIFPSQYLTEGARYNPTTESWLPTSTGSGVPTARTRHTAVWTGSEMIIWGGADDSSRLNTGGRYSPLTDSWRATATGANAPEARVFHTAVWTGSEMIVWGGLGTGNTGGRYDPVTDSWSATSVGAAAPSARQGHTAVWTGSEMIVWGGFFNDFGRHHFFNTGGRYRPSTDSWVATGTNANVPIAREIPTAVWTGSEMIVWGGIYDDASGRTFLQDSGGRYDPATDSWAATSRDANVPAARIDHTAVWTGSEMIVWGGETDAGRENTGRRYCACPNGRIVYRDEDGDGYGDPTVSTPSCDGAPPPGYVVDDFDCNDADPNIHAGAIEVCNGVDDDCDGTVDNGGDALCDDGNPCTDDLCGGAAGCSYTSDTDPCDDDNACTTNDTCGAGSCHGGPALDCVDGNVCTDDSCNPETGCAHIDNTLPCDDNSACTRNDTCGGGHCNPGGPTNCDDGNCCTIDACNPATGCTHSANTTAPVFTTQPSLGDTILWSPNHGYVDFGVTDTGAVAESSCGIASVQFASCASSQPENGTGTGDGNTLRDCVYEPATLHLRAERDGACSPIGRIYGTTLLAVDVCGNVTNSNPVTVNVWHDRAHPPTQGTVRFSTGNSQDVRNGTDGTYGTGCGAGSPAANGTINDHSDADPEMEIAQQAAIDVNGLHLGKDGSGNVELTWSAPVQFGQVTRFHIWRLNPITLFWTQVAEVSSQTNAYPDPILNDGSSWQYKVTAVIK